MSRRFPISAVLRALGPRAIRAAWVALALTAAPGAADAADKLVLQLHRAAQFEFAGYYAALWQGFYREAGLEVEIKPGAPAEAPPIDPVREIAEGRAQFGTGTVQLLIRAAQGQSLLLLAPIFQQSDARIYYRADGDFSSPGALLNGRVGRFAPSNSLDVELSTALQAEAIDPDKLRSLSVEPGQALADLASRRVDAVAGFGLGAALAGARAQHCGEIFQSRGLSCRILRRQPVHAAASCEKRPSDGSALSRGLGQRLGLCLAAS